MARALRVLPLTSRAFGAGELSFSKVRALTRVATPATEAELVTLAKNAPAAYVERIVAGLRKVTPDVPRPWDPEPEPSPTGSTGSTGSAGSGAADPDSADSAAGEQPSGESQPDGEPSGSAGPSGSSGSSVSSGPSASPAATAPAQQLRWRWDEQSDELVVWGRFGGADGKLILAALTRAELERIRTQEHEAHEPGPGMAEDEKKEAPAGEADDATAGEASEASAEESSAGGSQAQEPGARSEAVDRTAPPPSDAGPALVALAQMGLCASEAPAHAAAAEVIYLHGERHGDSHGDSHGEAHAAGAARPGVVRADEGPVLDEATGQEVLCGAAARCVLKGEKGAVLAYGRRRRLFSAAQLTALRLRDGCCQTPGCGRTRFLHAHHVIYWWDGGPTDLDNAVLLCSACHRSVHLGRLRITAMGGQRFEFVDATSGQVLEPAPPVAGQADLILAQRTIGPRTVTGGWFGEPLDLSAVTADLIAYWRQQAAQPPSPTDVSGWAA